MSSTLHIPGTAVAVVIDLPFLASEINATHKEVLYHGRGMLAAAAEAGKWLIAAKATLKHGEFKAWIGANCECSYRSAREYMQVAKMAELRQFDPDTSINAFLEAHAKPRPKSPEASPTLTREDAEYILKLHAVTERGGTENERDVAQRKLADFAGRFGMREDVAVDWAASKVPDHGKTSDQVELDRAEARIAELEARLAEIAKVRSALIAEFSTYPKEKLVDLCTRLTMQMEGYSEPQKKAA